MKNEPRGNEFLQRYFLAGRMQGDEPAKIAAILLVQDNRE